MEEKQGAETYCKSVYYLSADELRNNNIINDKEFKFLKVLIDLADSEDMVCREDRIDIAHRIDRSTRRVADRVSSLIKKGVISRKMENRSHRIKINDIWALLS